VISGRFMSPENRESYFTHCVNQARSVLTRYETMNRLLKGFRGFDRAPHHNTGNVIFWKCVWAQRGCSAEYEELNAIEEDVRELAIERWPRKRQGDLLSRLTSHDRTDSWSSMAELEVYRHCSNRLGKLSVEFHPSFRGRVPDVGVKLRSRRVFFEVTTTNPGDAEKKMTKICEEAAKAVFGRSSVPRHIVLGLDPMMLVKDSRGLIDEAASLKNIEKFVDRIGLWPQLDRVDSFDVGALARMPYPNKPVSDPPNRLSDLEPTLFNASHQREISSFLDRLKPIDLVESPILSVRSSDHCFRFVEARYELQHPTVSSLREQDSFLRHLERRIKYKICGGKLVPDHPNIIVIKALNVIVRECELGQPLAGSMFEPIERRIKILLKTVRNPDISAVMLYATRFSHSRTVLNDYASTDSRLSEDEIQEIAD